MRMPFFVIGLAVLLSLIAPAFAGDFELPDDPFQLIQQVTLSNGLHVVYAPNEKARTFRIEVVVRAGTASETGRTAGISHLLEHYLFTDARLDANTSYLEVIREKGGSANGHTAQMFTNYFATVPANEASWITGLFERMLFNRTFEQARVDQVRKPVLLEIGNPEPFAWFLDSPLMKLISPRVLEQPDFWQSEFGIHHEKFSHAHVSLNTLRLSAADLESYYKEYYHPSNITLFIAGRFDVPAMKFEVSQSFGSVADWKGKTLAEELPVYRIKPFVSTRTGIGTPYMAVGTKLRGLMPEDELTARVYLEFLAHRLMKEIRDRHGDTYTVRSVVALRNNFGAGYVVLEAPPERYREYLKYVMSLIDRETRRGGLTEAQFKEAMNLYSSHFLTDDDSESQLGLSEDLEHWTHIYGRTASPYDVFSKMTYPDFQKRLRDLFAPEWSYSYLVEPPLFFRLEGVFLSLVIIALFMAFARRALTSGFEHDRLRWMRKLTLAPIYLSEVGTLAIGALLSSYVIRVFNLLMLKSSVVQSSFVLSQYLDHSVSWVLALSACLLCCGALIRKALVSGDTLYLKSMTFFSRRIPLSRIESVEAKTVFQVLTSPATLFAMKWRFIYGDFCFWRPGTLIRLKDGRAYFVSIRNSKKACEELSAMIDVEETARVLPKAA